MKLRLDLLEYLTDEDILEDAGFDVHRWSAEPVFAKTGDASKKKEKARSDFILDSFRGSKFS